MPLTVKEEKLIEEFSKEIGEDSIKFAKKIKENKRKRDAAKALIKKLDEEAYCQCMAWKNKAEELGEECPDGGNLNGYSNQVWWRRV